MVPERVFLKISKYLKASSSERERKASFSSVFCFFPVYITAADTGDTAAVRGKLFFYFRYFFFVHRLGISFVCVYSGWYLVPGNVARTLHQGVFCVC